MAERHFRCLTAHFRDPELRVLAPEHSFCIAFRSFLAGASVSSPGRSLEGGRPAIILATSYVPFSPSDTHFSHYRANVEHLGATFLNFEPHTCDVHTWEVPISLWPAIKAA